MTRIFFIIIALAFVQLVNGQGACITAQTNLAGNTACVSAFSIGTDTDTICMGTCRDLFDAIISNCDAESAAGYVAFIGSLCGGTVECITAQANLATNTACTTAFSTGTDTDAICVGTCRDLFNAIIRSCDSATAGNYSTLVSNVCGISVECVAAQANLATNTVCTTAFSTGNDTDAICMGTCRDLFDAIISSCDVTTAAGYSTLISNLCSGTTECTTAQMNLAMNNMCTTVFSTGNDTDALCMGTCRDLFDAIISSCDGTTAAAYSDLTNTLCGSGDTRVLQQAFGIITLLLVAICALIF